jgi:hypothetical protein
MVRRVAIGNLPSKSSRKMIQGGIELTEKFRRRHRNTTAPKIPRSMRWKFATRSFDSIISH